MNLRIRERREALGLTQTELAKKVGKSFRTIQSWERGESYPNAEYVVVLCKIFNTDPNDLCDWYATHPREYAPALAMDETALIDDYRSCTPEQKRFIALAADNARGASLKMAERPAPGRSESGRGVA